VLGADGAVDDARVALEPEDTLRVFTAAHPAPAGAWGTLAEIARAFALE
jgi:hypothetical protein